MLPFYILQNSLMSSRGIERKRWSEVELLFLTFWVIYFRHPLWLKMIKYALDMVTE